MQGCIPCLELCDKTRGLGLGSQPGCRIAAGSGALPLTLTAALEGRWTADLWFQREMVKFMSLYREFPKN